jgi:hypothetical protein
VRRPIYYRGRIVGWSEDRTKPPPRPKPRPKPKPPKPPQPPQFKRVAYALEKQISLSEQSRQRLKSDPGFRKQVEREFVRRRAKATGTYAPGERPGIAAGRPKKNIITAAGLAKALTGPELSKLAPGGRPARDISLPGLALDVALLLPGTVIGKPARAIYGVGRAAGRTQKAVKLTRQGQRKTRTMTFGEKTQQFPLSPSRGTGFTQRVLDRFSERLTPAANRLEQGGRLTRAVAKPVTLASARARVPKQAGKMQKKESVRRRAFRAEEVSTVKGVGSRRLPLVKNEGVQAAAFWYAQLPRAYRNVEGLRLVRERLAGELAGDVPPDVVADVTVNLQKLDRIIARTPEVDDEIVESLSNMMAERRDSLIRAGLLKPETAAHREGLVSRWVGLEPTGEEVYIGHRMLSVPRQRPSLLPGGVSLGKTRRPQGVGQQNEARLISQGRARQSVEVAIEDWQAAQTYEFHNIAKEELAQMGEPIGGRLKPGYGVVNPRGHELPRHWKIDEEAKALEEGFDPETVLLSGDESGLLDDVEEYRRNYLATTEAEASHMVAQAREAGHLEDLRQVPLDVIRRYYSQFLPTTIQVATPGIQHAAALIGKGADIGNDLVYTSLIFANPGYIPANATANLVMAGLQQGALLPINLMRAGQIMTQAPPRVRNLLRAEVGTGGTAAAASETSPIRGFAGKVSEVADTPFRLSALVHELARVGVIAKSKPYLDANDWVNIEKFLTSPESRPLLNDVADRAVQAMVDFERLGSLERALAKRFLFVWSWIRGGSRYPLRFAADHPIRTALLTYTAAGAPGAPEPVQKRVQGMLPTFAEGMPPWLEQSIVTGETTVGGKTYPQILPTRSISPISTPLGLLGSAISRPGAQTFGEYLNPGIEAVYHVLNRQSPFGRELGSYREAALQSGERLLPNYGLARDLLSPPAEGGLYPEDVTRWGRTKRALRVIPYAVDPKEARAARVRWGVDAAIPASRTKYAEDRAMFRRAAPLMGLSRIPPDVDQALRVRQMLEEALESTDIEVGDYKKRAQIASEVYSRSLPWFDAAAAAEDLGAADSDSDYERIYRSMRAAAQEPLSVFKSEAKDLVED